MITNIKKRSFPIFLIFMIYLCDEIVAMEYQVTITETLSRAEYVEASSAVEAEEHIRDRYSKCDIVLSDAHFVDVDFNVNQASCEPPLTLHQENVLPYYTSKTHDFNLRWISLCRDKLKDNGTIWISGTYHNIFSVANALTARH